MRKRMVLMMGLALTLMCSALTFGGEICTDDQALVPYDPAKNGLPEDDGWAYLCGGLTGEPDLSSITGDILTILDDSTTDLSNYCRASIFVTRCDPLGQDFVYEATVQAKDVAVQSDCCFQANFDFVGILGAMVPADATYPQMDCRLAITTYGVGFLEKGAGNKWDWLDNNYIAIDNSFGAWDDPHVLRVELDKGNDEIRVYVDNTLELTVGLGDLDQTSHSQGNRMNLIASPYAGETEIDILGFCYRIGTHDLGTGSITCDDADFDDSGAVGTSDLLTIFSNWGDCPATCPWDLDGDDVVGTRDLLELFSVWGDC